MKELPQGWTWATLDEVAATEPRAITDGPFGSNLKSEHYTESGARVIRLQNIGDGEFRDERAYISLDHFEKLRMHEIQAGDLAFASLGESPPQVCVIPPLGAPAIVKADCIRVRVHSALLTDWIFIALRSPQSRAEAKMLVKGVGRPRLGLSQIRSLRVPLPPVAEQHRISVAMEGMTATLDRGTALISPSVARSKRLSHNLLELLVGTPWPAHWRVVTVAEAGQVNLGRQRHPDWHSGSHMRQYLRVANVFEDRLDLNDVMQMDFPPEVFKQFKLVPGDILLNEGQSPHLLGRPAMYRGQPENVAFTNSLIRFRANSDVLPEWALLIFRHYMHSGRFTREVRITTNIAHLSAGRFKPIEFPIPPVDEQQRIIDVAHRDMSHQVELERSLQAAEQRTASLRSSLLAAAFNGELVDQDPTDESADVLLARIRAEREAAGPQPRKPRARKVTT